MGVEQVGKTVDKCVEDTLALITKADELNANMAPIHELATQMYVGVGAGQGRMGRASDQEDAHRVATPPFAPAQN